MSFERTTPCGVISGTACQWPGIAAYKGIRYATAGRWEFPIPVTHWDGVYDATRYGACCYQPRAFYDEAAAPGKAFYYNEFRKGETYTYSEDCLFLNIWAPADVAPGDRLPVIFYIHGGGFTGGCGHEKHFDGPVWPTKGCVAVTINYRLGPMGFVCLPALADEAGFTGNYAFLDQLAALQWVRANIAAFGGDANNITGCSTLAEFRALAPAQLFAAWDAVRTQPKFKGMGCEPVVDGRFQVKTGPETLAADEQHHIPYLIGFTSEDIVPPYLYQMAQDWCARNADSYGWFFDRQLPGDDRGAWHSSDLWYWFGTLAHCWRPFTEKDTALSVQMVDYLTNFARTGDPNGADLPQWQTVTAQQTDFLRLGEEPTHMGSVDVQKLLWTMQNVPAVGE
uniref:carboxylesterase family protein n=1 Tax=Faecalibacterium sp. TaxID=1971605 RepID=UPI003FEFBDFA